MQRLRDLLVVIPGIGGSVLAGKNENSWNLTRRNLGAALIRPARLGLDRAPDLVPTDLVSTFSAFGPLLSIVGYESVGSLLSTRFRDVVTYTYRAGEPVPRNVDVLLFPYDFRRSVQHSAERLAEAVRRTLGDESTSRRRVIVLAHSMGGLVARYWIGPLAGWKVCSGLLTLGTPHRGAPKALDWLVHGPGVGALRLPSLRRVLRGWPSMYELLPQYPAVWSVTSGHEIELTQLPSSRYSDLFARMSAAGRAVHQDIADAWSQIPPEQVPDVVPYIGSGHATPNLVTLSEDGQLVITKEDPPWRGNVGWLGDGTVPALSAIPRELGGSRALWRWETVRHGRLACTPSFLDPLLSYSGEAVPTRGEDTPRRPWLGIDVEDILPAGESFHVGVTVHPEGAVSGGVLLAVSAMPPNTRPQFIAPMSGSQDNWSVVVPPLTPGRYKLELEARQVSGAESVFATADIVVLDAAEEAEAAEEVEA